MNLGSHRSKSSYQ